MAIFQDVSRAFEAFQSVHPTPGSSFEPANLPSNLINFYRIVEGYDADKINKLIQPLGVEESLEVYRSYPGTFTDKKYKNYDFSPLFFDTIFTSENFGLPLEFQTITPARIGSFFTDFGRENLIFYQEDKIRFR